MIPQALRLKNFLSYRQAAIDFSGLHTACICGANGAGKSSLLEAMTWALWGQSRVDAEDDIIHIGMKEAQVDFTFFCRGQIYRVIRGRIRNSGSSLELQMFREGQFYPLTARGIRATQQLIIDRVGMDYDTFVNSAYLRQGKADEFMLRRPGDRKQILADMLDLSRYDRLAEAARDIARSCKGEVAMLTERLTQLQAEIEAGRGLPAELAALQRERDELHARDRALSTQIRDLERQQQQRQLAADRVAWQQQQRDRLQADVQLLQQQQRDLREQIRQCERICADAATIARDREAYERLRAEESACDRLRERWQALQDERQALERESLSRQSDVKAQLARCQSQLEALRDRRQQLQAIFDKAPDIEAGLRQLHAARDRLAAYDDLQALTAPLLQRRHTLQQEIEREVARQTAQLDQLQRSRHDLLARHPERDRLRTTLRLLDERITTLQKLQVYQSRVRDKERERHDFLARLKLRAIDCQERFEQLHDRLDRLDAPDTPCPLCDRPLDEHHWRLVQQKHQQAAKELRAELWLLKEQQAVSEREIQILQEEYAEIEAEIAHLAPFIQQKGHLEAQIQAIAADERHLAEIEREIDAVQRQLEDAPTCREARQILDGIEHELARLNYDEKTHALVRGEVERWRWAEIEAAKLKDARRHLADIEAKQAPLAAEIADLQRCLQAKTWDRELQLRLEQCDRAIAALNYSPTAHDRLRHACRELQPVLLRERELTHARQQLPALHQQYLQVEERLQERTAALHATETTLAALHHQQATQPDPAPRLAALQQQQYQQRARLDDLLARIGSLEQALQQWEDRQVQQVELADKLARTRHRQHVHQELERAFGKNGIQAIAIETLLPQIEAEANRLLGQLSSHQMTVRFITQKAGRKGDRTIDTLEIEIADSRGTRPYETYSGGEAFRVNFAIRLALSRVIAQRSGGKLQTLIIDEGFGSQDREGCDLLVSALHAIANDFACILAITHMPQLKEAFHTLIEVTKTPEGSQVAIVG